MLKSYTPAHEEVITEKYLEFGTFDGSGYQFDLDENDRPILDTEASKISWANCQKAYPEGGRKKVYKRRFWMPASGICRCGCEVPLTESYYGVDECDCGLWYNRNGDEILPPEMWEERLEDWE